VAGKGSKGGGSPPRPSPRPAPLDDAALDELRQVFGARW